MKLTLLLLTASMLLGQRNFDSRFALLKTSALIAAAEKLTIQQPVSSSKRVRMLSCTVYCSVACTATLSRDGTAATTTTLAPVPISGYSAATSVSGYHTSNVGAGTTISIPFEVAAGGTMVLDLTGIDLVGDGTAKNFSVATNSITGTAKIQLIWREE